MLLHRVPFDLLCCRLLGLEFNPTLTGPIHSGISRLTNLKTLSLENCNLTGTIPTGMSYLTALTELYLSDSSCTGSLPSLAALTNLRFAR